MTKNQLQAGMLVITADGKARLVMPTKQDGLVLMAADNKALKVSKLADDLTHGQYKEDKDVVQVYDIMDNISGHLFDSQSRSMLAAETEVEDEDYENDWADDDDGDDDEEYCETDEAAEETSSATFTKADLVPGMLAITADGKKRLAIPTADMGTVLATSESKFIRMDKLNDDLTAGTGLKPAKTVDKVYGFAAGLTTDFYSEMGRTLLFDRTAE